MSALLFIADKRKKLERLDQISTIRLAMNGTKKDVERYMQKLARDADIRLNFEE